MPKLSRPSTTPISDDLSMVPLDELMGDIPLDDSFAPNGLPPTLNPGQPPMSRERTREIREQLAEQGLTTLAPRSPLVGLATAREGPQGAAGITELVFDIPSGISRYVYKFRTSLKWEGLKVPNVLASDVENIGPDGYVQRLGREYKGEKIIREAAREIVRYSEGIVSANAVYKRGSPPIIPGIDYSKPPTLVSFKVPSQAFPRKHYTFLSAFNQHDQHWYGLWASIDPFAQYEVGGEDGVEPEPRAPRMFVVKDVGELHRRDRIMQEALAMVCMHEGVIAESKGRKKQIKDKEAWMRGNALRRNKARAVLGLPPIEYKQEARASWKRVTVHLNGRNAQALESVKNTLCDLSEEIDSVSKVVGYCLRLAEKSLGERREIDRNLMEDRDED